MSSWNYKKSTRSYKIFSNYVAWQALTQAKCASIFSDAVVPMCYSNGFLKNFANFTREISVLESLLNKVERLEPCKFIEERFQHMCFPVKRANFLKTPFLQNISDGWFYFLSCCYWSIKKGLFLFESHVIVGGCPFFCK